MKIYTEEQLTRYLLDEGVMELSDLANNLIPSIELPSDEEIEEYAKSTGYYGHCTQEYHEGIEEGAKYVINKIKGSNK